jgi:4'-phosphopantetheinyl transferase
LPTLSTERLLDTLSIQLWHCNIAADDQGFQRCLLLLDAAEQAQALAIKNESRRHRYVIAQGHLRSLLSKTVKQPPEALRIAKTEHGKPYLVDFPEVAFNLSHSADAMVIAIGQNCRLGIDMEICKSRTNFPALVDKCFAEVEASWWHALPEIEKSLEFYRFWTRKEAFVKAIGRGISLGLNRCVINPENPETWLSVPENCGQASAWHVRDIDLGRDVCCALVTDKAIANIALKSI